MKTPLCFALLLAVISTGCVTHAVQDHYRESRWYRAAEAPQLALFHSADGKDVVVRYSEARAGTGPATTRAYHLVPNARRIFAGQKPVFVEASETNGLKPIELLPAWTELAKLPSASGTDELRARLLSSGRGFTLIDLQRESEPFTLPAYEADGWRVAKAVAKVPAVAFDTVVTSYAFVAFAAIPMTYEAFGGIIVPAPRCPSKR